MAKTATTTKPAQIPTGAMQPAEVREARQKLGLTAQQLADVLELDGKLSEATVRSWEKGRRPITGPARVAIRMMLKYGVPTS